MIRDTLIEVLPDSPRNIAGHRIFKVAGWFVLAFLVLVVATLAFVYFSPDYNMFMVKGQSMEPTINLGDMVISVPTGGFLSSKIEPGTIVTYHKGNSMVTHRVISIEGNNLITKGDAVEDPDSQPLPISEVQGVYLFKIPYVGYFSNFMRTTVGWLAVVVVPTILLVGFIVRKIIREATGKTERGSQTHGEVEHA